MATRHPCKVVISRREGEGGYSRALQLCAGGLGLVCLMCPVPNVYDCAPPFPSFSYLTTCRKFLTRPSACFGAGRHQAAGSARSRQRSSNSLEVLPGALGAPKATMEKPRATCLRRQPQRRYPLLVAVAWCTGWLAVASNTHAPHALVSTSPARSLGRQPRS